MHPSLEKLISSVQSAVTLEDFQTATEGLRDHYKVAHIVYHWVNSNGERFGAGTYSQEWVDR